MLGFLLLDNNLYLMRNTMPEYHVVAACSELPDEGQMHVELNGKEILLVKHDGAFYAIDYYCSHEMFSLEGGDVHEGCITCPYHGAEFKLDNGSVQAAPAWESIATYPLKVENDTISISVQG
jgi:3-phenylpropionate/trans-cinnamate dioxygenase ferredoxin subunit